MPERTALVGFRDRAESLADGMRQPEDLARPAPPIWSRGTAARRASPRRPPSWRGASAAGPFWLHLDVDVLDEAVFPATDYLQPDGLDWEELAACSRRWPPPTAVGASLACYNPDKDPGLDCGRRLVAALAG